MNKKYCADPIIIISSERSGSNLLRRILGEHSTISAPRPVHFFKFLSKIYPLVQKKGSYDKNQFQKDIAFLSKEGSGNWDYNPELINTSDSLEQLSFSELIGSIYDENARQQDKSRWVSKENNIFDYAYHIIKDYPKAKFIYLVRDVRDVCCSERKIPSRKRHVRFLAEKWAEEQRKSLAILQDLSESGNCFLVRYEDILVDPETIVKDLCDYLEIPFETKMMSFHSNPEAAQDAKVTVSWKNLNKPILKDNFNKFKKELSKGQVITIEKICGPLLNRLGYTLVNENLVAKKSYSELIIDHLKNLAIRGSFIIGKKLRLSKKEEKNRSYGLIEKLIQERQNKFR